MQRTITSLFIAFISLSPLASKAEIGVKLIGDGFKKTVWAESPKGVKNDLWILEKTGKIKILNTKTGDTSLFLDVTEQITSKSNEQGLLGLAFADDYLSSGRFYLYYTNPKGDTEICRYIAHGADKRESKASTKELLLTFKQDYRNHNGGWIGFGPDGYLYIGAGDGGAANDPKKNVGGSKPEGAIDPIYVYPHDSSPKGGLSVTGGYVYRGPIKSLQGKYFFADYVKPHIWSFEVKNGKMDNFQNWTDQLNSENIKITAISSFGQDSVGNLLIISHSGKIYQLIEK